MTWQSGITDVGIANLRHCDRLEHVNLMGPLTGDGAIAALQGKPNLISNASARGGWLPMPGCRCSTTFRYAKNFTAPG
jgi:hypothetical protein